jgi:hypothetical protein
MDELTWGRRPTAIVGGALGLSEDGKPMLALAAAGAGVYSETLGEGRVSAAVVDGCKWVIENPIVLAVIGVLLIAAFAYLMRRQAASERA